VKPLSKGSKRTALAENIEEITMEALIGDVTTKGIAIHSGINVSHTLAAILGGAINESLDQALRGRLVGLRDDEELKKTTADFWRLFNENTWRLTRALKASGLIKEIK